jgi:NADH-quinone oxidoreductase subunit G
LTDRAAKLTGWQTPSFFADAAMVHKVKTAIARLEPELAVSLREVEQADFVLAVGADPLNEAPMLALALRQAVRNGARVVVLDPRPVELPFDFVHLPVRPAALDAALAWIVKKSIDPGRLDPAAARYYAALPDTNVAEPGLASAAADLLRASRRPVIVCGTDIVQPEMARFAADAVLLLAAAQKVPGLFYLMPERIAFAAGLLSDVDASITSVLNAAAVGNVKALIFTEIDPFATFPDRELLEHALAKVELVIVLDYLDTAVSRKAHVFLPTQTLFEAGGHFINQEGRAQESPAAFAGGTPVLETGGGDHPAGHGPGCPAPTTAGRAARARLAGEAIPTKSGPSVNIFGNNPERSRNWPHWQTLRPYR